MKNIFLLLLLFTISTVLYSQNPCPETPIVSYSGKIYNTVQIGTQCWLKENLDVGIMILGNIDQINNNITEKYCYNDSTQNCDKYGGLYQWDEVMKYVSVEKAQGICPSGWHVPTVNELLQLQSTANDSRDALLAVGQMTGTNITGFSALFSGRRYNSSSFRNLGDRNYFWSSNVNESNTPQYMGLDAGNNTIGFSSVNKQYGVSVRCIKDDSNTSVLEDEKLNSIPTKYSLSQNYPNPFNPVTKIEYSIPEFGMVTITVYDMLGMEILVLVCEEKRPGNYQTEFNGSKLSSGVYFYKLRLGNKVINKKMLLIK